MASFTVFSPAAQNSHTASDEHWRSLVTRLRVGPLSSTIQLSHRWASLNKTQVKQRCRYFLVLNFASRVGTCLEIVEPFKHLLCVTAHPQFWCLSCEHPWVLPQGNTVLVWDKFLKLYFGSSKFHCLPRLVHTVRNIYAFQSCSCAIAMTPKTWKTCTAYNIYQLHFVQMRGLRWAKMGRMVM